MPTGIEWTDETWPICVGCGQISPGCKLCYAMRSVHRVNLCQTGAGRPAPYEKLVELVQIGGRKVPRWTGAAAFFPERLAAPLGWRAPRRIFVASQSDVFHDHIGNTEIAAIFGVAAATPRHTYQVLTKRPERMRAWFEWAHGEFTERQRAITAAPNTTRAVIDAAAEYLGIEHPTLNSAWRAAGADRWPLPNVWIGVSVEDRKHGRPRIAELRRVPAAVRWLSVEPLLEDLGELDLTGIGWVIAGCESGPGARAADVGWFRSIRDQCAAAGVPFFLKQAVEPTPHDQPAALLAGIRHFPPTDAAPDGSHRKAGGVVGLPFLDGVQHADFPVTSEAA